VLAVTRLLALVISMLLSCFVEFACSCVILGSSWFVILIPHMMLSSFEHNSLTRRQYAFSSFMCDDSESGGKMRRKAYVSEDKHENRILVRAD
jgi:hypothetical protein